MIEIALLITFGILTIAFAFCGHYLRDEFVGFFLSIISVISSLAFLLVVMEAIPRLLPVT